MITNVRFGYWHQLSDDSGNRPFGSLCRQSKNKGDGKFCEECLEYNFYNWLDLTDRNSKYETYEFCKVCRERKQ